ncbi:acyl-CoA/acyl-ACP dehydrogenase [Neobacillus mesonae]|nr:acyl-CoA/acyl-ACP dehydrogenase [Neobacillus mesonae]
MFDKEDKDLVAIIGEIAERHKESAARADENNELNTALIEDLLAAGYHTYSVPKEYGGQGASLTDFLLCQERIAMVDAATALAIGWHHITMFNVGQNQLWEEGAFRSLCRAVMMKGALINAADSEKATGSPSRGGKPQTSAQKTSDGYTLNGRKIFTSLSTALHYFIVSAADTVTGEVGEYLVHKDTAGVNIEPTWNMTGMRGTASHDLVLDQVQLPEEALVRRRAGGKKSVRPNAYLLNIPAVYLGIAQGARREALTFAAAYQPNSLTHPIIELPHIQQKIGHMEMELTTARHFLYSVAARWEQLERPLTDEALARIAPDLGAAKTFAVQNALSIVDTAMRIVGVHSLASSHPLSRMYRDVRFGLHNPPMDDAVYQMLAKRAITELETPEA